MALSSSINFANISFIYFNWRNQTNKSTQNPYRIVSRSPRKSIQKLMQGYMQLIPEFMPLMGPLTASTEVGTFSDCILESIFMLKPGTVLAVSSCMDFG